jgi:multidrug efflux pump subunit AcrB
MKGFLESHARAIALGVFLITLAGLFARQSLPVTLFPPVDYPRVAVAIDAGERDAAQMAADITRPAEIALRRVRSVTHIRSTTSRGSAEVALSFERGDDMIAATLATQGAMATILPDFPTGTRFDVRQSDLTIFPSGLTEDGESMLSLASRRGLTPTSTEPRRVCRKLPLLRIWRRYDEENEQVSA